MNIRAIKYLYLTYFCANIPVLQNTLNKQQTNTG